MSYKYDISSVCRPFKQEDLKEGRLYLCIYFANTTLSIPFIQYVLYKYPNGSLKDHLVIPFIEYTKKHSLENQLRIFFSKIFEESIEGHIIDIKGLMAEDYLFMDISEYMQHNREALGFLKNRIDCWWNGTFHEIVNIKHIFQMPIHETVTKIFLENPILLKIMHKEKIVENPIVVYAGYSYNRCLFTSIFGRNKSFSNAYFGMYYYFTDFEGAVFYALRAKQKKDIKRLGIMRSIIFTKKTYLVLNNPNEKPSKLSILSNITPKQERLLSRVYKPFGEWGKTNNTLFVHKPILEDNTTLDIPLNIVITHNENSLTLNWGELDVSHIHKKWSQNDKYYIK